MDLPGLYDELDRLYGEPGADVAGFLREALRRARLAGDGRTCVAVANELGSVLRLRGELAESEALYEEVLSGLRKLGAGDEERARALINLGDVYVAQGRHESAVEAFDRAEALLGSGEEHPYEVSAVCNNRSAALRGLGRFSAARRDLRRAARLLESVPNSEGRRATNAINLAQVLMDEGRLDEAEEAIAPALEAYRVLCGGRDVHRPHALATAAKIAYLRGRYAEAEGLYREAAVAMRDKLGDAPNVAALEREAKRMRALGRS